MAGSDAILVGEDWISEHYFTTEATSQSFQARILARRKEWEENKDHGTTLTRFTEHRRTILDRLATLGSPGDDTDIMPVPPGVLGELYATVRSVLGYDGIGLHTERNGPVLRVSAPGMTEEAPLAIIEAAATGSIEGLLQKDGATLLEPYALDEKTSLTSLARTVSALFVADEPPAYALVLAGRFLLVAERARWAEGRYLAVDLQVVCERNDSKRGGEVDRALTCLSAESLAPDAEGNLWWDATLEESIKHTVGVSRDLREGVRLSIEILANEVLSRRVRRGLDPLAPERAQPLAIQSLRFLYRILFLLYAEASPELGVLPVGSQEYERGYSLDRLRELTLVELATPQGQQGSHLYDSLGVLFRLVDRDPATAAAEGQAPEGLEFRSLRADLFRPVATALIDEVGLGNEALQKVLRHLLLSKEAKGRDRGFISYAELGINQLGAVYEGLMSYTGFFADTDLFEVAKDGDPSKGSWVVPVERAEGIDPKDFVRTADEDTGEDKSVLHQRGTFVFRLAGRERQQSASYYTPEVLTRFVVSQALEELLDQDGHITSAEEILRLTVCEPAMGSGAFAIEAVRQLAEQYLRRRQDELDERIEPDAYPRELQRVKAYLALHQVYGVDLNATAVELAEISLWLDTMVEGLDAPWLGLHLRRGNSLIGARRATYRKDQVSKKAWLTNIPLDAPMSSMAEDIAEGRLATGVAGAVHHFLLPSAGWGSAVDAKEAKALAPDALAALKTWRRAIQAKPTAKQVDALVDLAYRVEALWQIALRRLEIAEREIRRAVPLWGTESGSAAEGAGVQREQIEVALSDSSGALGRLRRVMDAWCALWFWPLTGALTTHEIDGRLQQIAPPTLEQWIDALRLLLGRHAGKGKGQPGQVTLVAGTSWTELGNFESLDLSFAAASQDSAVLEKHPWLRICAAIAARQGFFHWDLDFAPVMSGGGFSLVAGNPPWVRPRVDLSGLLAEGDPWWALRGADSNAEEGARKNATLQLPGVLEFTVDTVVDTVCTSSFLGHTTMFPLLSGLQPDLYRGFMLLGWRLESETGVVALIHPSTHLTDEKGSAVRRECYLRARQMWQFVNERKLFEIGNQRKFSVNVYKSPAREVSFLAATSLMAPETVLRSLVHDGSGLEPALKTPDGAWNLAPHSSRILRVTKEVLKGWAEAADGSQDNWQGAKFVSLSSNTENQALASLAGYEHRLRTLKPRFDDGWNEAVESRDGGLEVRWGYPRSAAEVVLQGAQLSTGNALFQIPNPSLKSHRDYSEVDLETISRNYLPATKYKLTALERDYTSWENGAVKASDYYLRRMAHDGRQPRRKNLDASDYSAGLHARRWRLFPGSSGWRTIRFGHSRRLPHVTHF
jgi:hypothetical protein